MGCVLLLPNTLRQINLILREQEIFTFSFNLYPGLRKIMKLFLLERNLDRL